MKAQNVKGYDSGSDWDSLPEMETSTVVSVKSKSKDDQAVSNGKSLICSIFYLFKYMNAKN